MQKSVIVLRAMCSLPCMLTLASLILLARYGAPPLSGWFAIIIRRCASLILFRFKAVSLHAASKASHTRQQWISALQRAAATHLRPRIWAASLRSILVWNPPLIHLPPPGPDEAPPRRKLATTPLRSTKCQHISHSPSSDCVPRVCTHAPMSPTAATMTGVTNASGRDALKARALVCEILLGVDECRLRRCIGALPPARLLQLPLSLLKEVDCARRAAATLCLENVRAAAVREAEKLADIIALRGEAAVIDVTMSQVVTKAVCECCSG